MAWQLALAQEFGGAYPFEWDAASGTIIASAALKARFELPPDGVLTAEHVLACIDRDQQDAVRQVFSEALKGRGFECEFHASLPDGARLWVMARGRTIDRGRAGRLAGIALDITERKAVERALAEKEAALLASEARFRAVQETTIDGFMMLDSVRDETGEIVDFRWTYVNEAAVRIVGLPRDAFLGQRLLDVMPGNRDEGLFDSYRTVVETGRPWSQEFSYRHEGLDVYIRAVASRVGDGFAVTFADLSERRRAEEAIIAAEQRWRAILNTMPQMVWSGRTDGQIDFYNDRWYEFTGKPSGASDGMGWADVVHPDDQARSVALWLECVRSGAPYEIEYRLRHASGTWRWALGRALPLRNPDGTIERWFGTSTDIDHIKSVEARLQASEERLQLALDAAEVIGTWDWDVGANRIYADARFARIFGVDPVAAAEGAPLEQFLAGIDAQDRDHVRAAIERTIATGEPYRQEFRTRSSDAGERWVSARGNFVARDGRKPRFPGAVFDITDRRRIEEARELLSRELSHRIKNIFAVVNSLVTLSARGQPEVQAFAETVRARLTALGRAHDFVRPQVEDEDGHAIDEAQTAHGLFEALLEPYRAEAEGKILIDGCDSAVGVRAATALALVVHELATNAVKYGALSQEGGAVSIACDSDAETYRIVWRERGGPPVERPPERQGFGTLMSERTAAAQLRASVEHRWEPAGLTVTLCLPLDELAQ